MHAKKSAIVKDKLISLSRRYALALEKHLKAGPRASLQSARQLGRDALAVGLETLGIARMHEAALKSCTRRSGAGKRANAFFAETMVPIEQTHRAALEANARLRQGQETFDRRIVDLTASNRSLKQGAAQRKKAEEEFKRNGRQFAKQFEKSRCRQEYLRLMAHQVISAREIYRKKISRELQDDVVQSLLAINVRLLSLKGTARGDLANLAKEIACTQRLVEQSVESINRFAHELKIHQHA
jgi:signal transduction histidine kinase